MDRRSNDAQAKKHSVLTNVQADNLYKAILYLFSTQVNVIQQMSSVTVPLRSGVCITKLLERVFLFSILCRQFWPDVSSFDVKFESAWSQTNYQMRHVAWALMSCIRTFCKCFSFHYRVVCDYRWINSGHTLQACHFLSRSCWGSIHCCWIKSKH